MIYLHKILPFFVMPVGIASLLILAGVLFRKRYLCLVGVVVLWCASMPVTSNVFMRAAEGWTVREAAAVMPEADAIVVLSGGRTLAPGDPPVSEWNDADRFFGGIELYQAGRAPLLVFTGGWAPWRPGLEPEGHVLKQFALDLGIPAGALRVTGTASNTAQEAVAVAELLNTEKGMGEPPRILLVTSAFHMRRSLMLFERAGLEAIPFRVDFQVSEGRKPTILDVLPDGGSLRQTERALKEAYGYLYYTVRSHRVVDQTP